MFHSIGLENSDWVFKHISEPIYYFEQKIKYLCRNGFNFLFWQDLYEYMSGKRKLKLPAVMLTFDDGYLDNWIYVFPIIKKYGAKATIFVNPEFVDPSCEVRPNLDDVWERKKKKDELVPYGFLNWVEMRIMETSKLIDIQSHSLTHTWYFSGPKLLDFYEPDNKKYPWLVWNHHPDQKPFYLIKDKRNLIPAGLPVYEHQKALICKKYYPPEKVGKGIIDYVQENGNENFFQLKNWRKELEMLHTSLMKKHKIGERFENDQEYEKRIFDEHFKSKLIIEEKLDKKVDFICFPGGGYNQKVLEVAKEVGYKAWTLSSRDRTPHKNIPGSDPTMIKRLGSVPRQKYKDKFLGYTNGPEFISHLKRGQGSLFDKYLGRFKKVVKIGTSFLGGASVS